MNYANDPSTVLDKDKKDSEDTEGEEVVEDEVAFFDPLKNLDTGSDRGRLDMDTWDVGSQEIGDTEEQETYGGKWEDGGQVFEMDQLASLLSLLGEGNQMQSSNQNTEKPQPTITEYFASQGKTLGGNNIQSLSQKLGR